MIVKVVPSAIGRKALLICDDEGQPLPCQADVQLDQPLKGAPRLTVTFVIDGQKLRLED